MHNYGANYVITALLLLQNINILLKSTVHALSFPRIWSPPVTTINLTHLQELDFTDYSYSGKNSVTRDILIGSDHYWDIVVDVIKGKDGPVAISSRLGWLLSESSYASVSYLALRGPASMTAEEDKDELTSQLQGYWATESVGITNNSISDDDGFSRIILFECS